MPPVCPPSTESTVVAVVYSAAMHHARMERLEQHLTELFNLMNADIAAVAEVALTDMLNEESHCHKEAQKKIEDRFHHV